MRQYSRTYMTLALSAWVLASCGDDVTQPSTEPSQTPPALAVAHDSWLTRRDMPFERWDLAVATVTNAAGQTVLYAIGGRTATGAGLGRVQAYNVATNSWSWHPDMPAALHSTNGAGVVNGKIYVSGGLGKNWSYDGINRTLFVYDPAKKLWARKRDMPEWGARGVTGVINGKLYVVTTCFEAPPIDYYFQECGDFVDQGGRPPVSNFFRYNPGTDRWIVLPSPGGMYHMGDVLYGKLYVTDGKNTEAYDPATNRWTVMAASGGRVRIGATAVAQGAKLWLLGGLVLTPDNGWQPDTTMVYHPIPNTWSTAAPMPTARAGVWGGVAAARVFLNMKPRIEVVGGRPPGNNLQYIP